MGEDLVWPKRAVIASRHPESMGMRMGMRTCEMLNTLRHSDMRALNGGHLVLHADGCSAQCDVRRSAWERGANRPGVGAGWGPNAGAAWI
jgi:hypothetical protein